MLKPSSPGVQSFLLKLKLQCLEFPPLRKMQQNKCSVGPETSICPRGKGQGPTSFSERGLFFSEIWTASQGLTVV